MKLFLSHETQSPAGEIIALLRRDFQTAVQHIFDERDYTYGTDIKELCIISCCVSKSFYNDNNWKERVRYYKHDKTTDIRLNIDYEEFINSDTITQKRMYQDNIIESILRFKSKYPNLDFRAETLVKNIKEAL